MTWQKNGSADQNYRSSSRAFCVRRLSSVMLFPLVVVLLTIFQPISAYFSISYYFPDAQQSDVLYSGQTFAQAPDAKHVADLYTRLSDLPRLAKQGTPWLSLRPSVIILEPYLLWSYFLNLRRLCSICMSRSVFQYAQTNTHLPLFSFLSSLYILSLLYFKL